MDGLGELAGAPGAASELAEDVPVLELGVRALAGRAKCRAALRSFGARAASSATVSFTYRHAVAVLTPNPAASSVNVSPLRR
jgi:hypothetical protein